MPIRIANPLGQILTPTDSGPGVAQIDIGIAPFLAWGVRCSGTGAHWFLRPRAADKDMNICHCGNGLGPGLALVPDDVALLNDPVTVAIRTWWHSTPSESIDLHSGDAMHWGSRESALERAVARLAYTSQRVHLFSATLRPGIAVHQDLLLERPALGTTHHYGTAVVDENTVVRYVNGTEAPGAISLMLRPSALATVTYREELHLPL